MSGKIILGFSIVVATFILFFGVILIGSDLLIDKIQKPNRTYIGILFLVYGTFRAYRAKLQFDRKKPEE